MLGSSCVPCRTLLMPLPLGEGVQRRRARNQDKAPWLPLTMRRAVYCSCSCSRVKACTYRLKCCSSVVAKNCAIRAMCSAARPHRRRGLAWCVPPPSPPPGCVARHALPPGQPLRALVRSCRAAAMIRNGQVLPACAGQQRPRQQLPAPRRSPAVRLALPGPGRALQCAISRSFMRACVLSKLLPPAAQCHGMTDRDMKGAPAAP